MTAGRVAQFGHYVGGNEHVNRDADRAQAAQDMQRVMLEAGEGLRRKQQIDRNPFGGDIRHVADASGTLGPRAA